MNGIAQSEWVNFVMLINTLLAAFFLSFSLSFLICRFGKKLRLLDIPNERSLHTNPVPRGGGLAFIFSFLLGSFFLMQQGLLPPLLFKAFMIAGIPIAVIGLLDDLFHSSILIRFIVHTLAAIAVLWLFHGMPVLDLGFSVWHWNQLGWLIGILGLVWMTNFYNFMDGMDGLSGSEGIFVGLNIVLLLLFQGQTELVPALLLLCFSIFGFLLWNLPPAKLFMGDCGSGFLGFIFGIFLITSTNQSLLTPWQWLIVFGAFWVDATLTLLRRVINGEKWYQAHANHAFQHAILYWGDRKVLLGFLCINVLWLLPISLLSLRYRQLELLWVLIAIVPLVLLALKLKAGKSLGRQQVATQGRIQVKLL